MGNWVATLLASALIITGCTTGKSTAGADPPKGSAEGSSRALWSANLADGSKFDLQSTLKSGPVVLYVISPTCPISAMAHEHYQQIAADAAKNGLNFVAIFAGPTADFEAWNRKYKPDYRVVLDPDYEICKLYGVTVAPTSILLGTDGTVAGEWVGLSRSLLASVHKAALGAVKGKPAPLEFESAPTRLEAG